MNEMPIATFIKLQIAEFLQDTWHSDWSTTSEDG